MLEEACLIFVIHAWRRADSVVEPVKSGSLFILQNLFRDFFHRRLPAGQEESRDEK